MKHEKYQTLSWDTFVPGYVKAGTVDNAKPSRAVCRVHLAFRTQCMATTGSPPTYTAGTTVLRPKTKAECENNGCCWYPTDPDITRLNTAEEPACQSHNFPGGAPKIDCSSIGGADQTTCEQNACCWDASVAPNCFFRAFYDKDVCYEPRHETHEAVCKFVSVSSGIVLVPWFPFTSCARKSCGDMTSLKSFSYSSASYDFVALVFHWQNLNHGFVRHITGTDGSLGSDLTKTQTAEEWRIAQGGSSHPCFSLRYGEQCTVVCDSASANEYAGPSQVYDCKFDATTSQMRLKGASPAFRGGPCKGFKSATEQSTVDFPKYPCNNVFVADSEEADCTCCVGGLCTSDGHPEIDINTLVKTAAESCSGLSKNSDSSETATTVIPDLNKCKVRCVDGYREHKNRLDGVWYECPYKDPERNSNYNVPNTGPTRIIPGREYSGLPSQYPDWDAKKINCVSENCFPKTGSTVYFQHTGIQSDAVVADQDMVTYDASNCVVVGQIFSVAAGTRCTVNCGKGYTGTPMDFKCIGTNNVMSGENEPAAYFQGIDPTSGLLGTNNAPTCLPKQCSSWGSATMRLPSPFHRYVISACANAKTDDAACVVQCADSFTPANNMKYRCFNRNFQVLDAQTPELFGFVPESFYEEKVKNQDVNSTFMEYLGRDKRVKGAKLPTLKTPYVRDGTTSSTRAAPHCTFYFIVLSVSCD